VKIDEAVEMIVKYIRKTHRNQTEAVGLLWGRKIGPTLCPGDVSKLAKEALCHRVSGVLTNGGTGRPTPKNTAPAVNVQVQHTAAPKPEPVVVTLPALEGVHYTVADGSSKPLREFDPKDFEFCIQVFSAQVAGLTAKTTAFEQGIQLLKKYGVTRICDLPDKVYQTYQEEWEKIR
jgi:hypothetical protein